MLPAWPAFLPLPFCSPLGSQSMPALLLSKRSVATLKELIAQHGGDAELKDIQSQLKEPIEPAQEGAVYPDGTVIDHRCLVQVSKWAAANQIDFGEDLTLTALLRGAQVAVAVKPKPARVRMQPRADQG